MGTTGPPVYSQRYVEALAYAADLHATQMRKAGRGEPGTIPYLAHLIEVSALVWSGGGDEDQAIGGLLHDALEDQYPIATAEIIEQKFGPGVRDIVLTCTDGLPGATRASEGWLLRKSRYLAHLDDADERALLVTAADKISNAQAIVADLADPRVGEAVWLRFTNPRQAIAWYYAEVSRAITQRIPGNTLQIRLARLSGELREAAGGDDLSLAYPDATAEWIAEQTEPLATARRAAGVG